MVCDFKIDTKMIPFLLLQDLHHAGAATLNAPDYWCKREFSDTTFAIMRISDAGILGGQGASAGAVSDT